jgi:hypothetical protein
VDRFSIQKWLKNQCISTPVEIHPRTGLPVPAMITKSSRTGLSAVGDQNLVETQFAGGVRLKDHTSVMALFRFTAGRGQ